MTPGAGIQIKPNWRHCYRKAGTATIGIIEALSPNGTVARVRFDEVASSFVMVDHLEPAAERRRNGSNGPRRRSRHLRDYAGVIPV